MSDKTNKVGTVYNIIVEETIGTIQMVNGKWVVLSEDGQGNKEYGYAPPREEWVEKTRRIYEQTVHDLDLTRVILAVNGLSSTPVIKPNDRN